MEDKIFDIVTDLIRDDISKEQAIDKLLILHGVVECKHDFEPYYNWCSELAGYRCEKCGEEKD